MAAPPAFQFYADDYLVGTTTMTLAEKGAYMDCLAYQWAVGSIPGDDPKAMARVIRSSPAEAKKVWPVVSAKFTRHEDGSWRNARLERERTKQSEFRNRQGRNGSKGGRPKNPDETQTFVGDGVLAKPTANPNKSSTSSSTSAVCKPSSQNDDGRATRVAAASPGLVTSPADYDRLKRTHRHVGARLRVPNVLHAEFVAKLGGDNPDAALAAWYADLDIEVEASKEPMPDVFTWLRPKFVAWAGAAVKADDWSKWAPGGAFDQQIAVRK